MSIVTCHMQSYRLKPGLLYIALAAFTILMCGTFAAAAEWRIEPELRLGYEVDDNATLNEISDDVFEIEGSILQGSATFGYATQKTNFNLTPTLRWRQYDENLFDSDDQFLDFNFSHSGVKSRFEIRGDYGREATRTAERADADPDIAEPDEIPGDEAGRALGADRREKFRISPRWSYDLSPTSVIAAQLTYEDADYDNTSGLSLVPYSDRRFRTSLTRKFSNTSRMFGSASLRRYEPENAGVNNSNDVDGFGVSIGMENNPSETTRLRIELGAEESEPEGLESDTNFIWDLSYVKKLQTLTLLAQYKRSVTASGTGHISMRDAVNLSAQKSFSQRFTGGLALRAYDSKRLSTDPNAGGKQDYIQLGLQLTYALTRAVSLQADYRYSDIDRVTATSGAESNNFRVWFVYQPRAFTVSR